MGAIYIDFVAGRVAAGAVGAIDMSRRSSAIKTHRCLVLLLATVLSPCTCVSSALNTVAWKAANTAALQGVSVVAGVLFGAVVTAGSLESTSVSIGAGGVAVCCIFTFIGSILFSWSLEDLLHPVALKSW